MSRENGSAEVDKFVQESQKNLQGGYGYWLPYNSFQDIKHIANGGYGSVYSAVLKDNNVKVALKEIYDSKNDISKFLKEVKNLITTDLCCVTKCYGISKNPSSQNYIIVMKLYDSSFHKFITSATSVQYSVEGWCLETVAYGLISLHAKKLVHRDLHSGNILINNNLREVSITDLGLCRLENDLILKSDNKSNNIYGSIPYIPPEVLRGNEFTKKGDIYSFGGIMYETATGKQPFYDRAHDTRLIIDICNGVRPKIPDIILDCIPQWYLDLMYKCWSDDPSERPTAKELYDSTFNFNDFKTRNKFKRFLFSSKSHPQSCYISRRIHTLHGLHNSLEDIISGISQDPNSLKSNESTGSSISTYDIYSKEPQECFDWEKEIQNQEKKRSFSTLDCDSLKSKECINSNKEDNIILKKIK
ncbi:hypothetical protein Glove_311g27 [Diversispora epigaea]|uniref:mitogen-activated protein kinase kinase n=1 Tax=Diversispora epigaea TaxID=1348612 RepID=A0A397HRF6_9GLOM|nr:hypothetical protein Glove_311g27 [Diversispora epigaea]